MEAFDSCADAERLYVDDAVICQDLSLSESSVANIEEKRPNLMLLPPDHPYLLRFQAQLKAYLIEKREQLKNEVDELKLKHKQSNEIVEDLGAKLYDSAKMLEKQKVQIEDTKKCVDEHKLRRQQTEAKVEELNEVYAEKQKMLKANEGAYKRRMFELDSMSQLQNKLCTIHDEIVAEVQCTKRIVDKDAKLTKELDMEKKKSELIYFGICQDILNKEKELELIQEHLGIERAKMKSLKESLINANVDAELLQNEHEKLRKAWNEVILAIEHRDKIMMKINSEVTKYEEHIKLCKAGIQSLKKHIQKEVMESQKLQTFRLRLRSDLMNHRAACQKLWNDLQSLDVKLMEFPILMKESEDNLKLAKRENTQLMSQIRRIQFKIDKQFNKKFEIEEGIMKLMENSIISNKANKYRLKLLRKLSDDLQVLELSHAQAQNGLAVILCNAEKSAAEKPKQQELQLKLKEQLGAVEKKLDDTNAEFQTMKDEIILKLNQIQELNSKIHGSMKSSENSHANSNEAKVHAVERSIAELDKHILKQQDVWMLMQRSFISMTKKRNKQVIDIQTVRIQLSLLQQKAINIDVDVEEKEAEMRTICLEMDRYRTRLELLNRKMNSNQRNLAEIKDMFQFEQSDMLNDLKDKEMCVLRLEQEVLDLQKENECLGDYVLELHARALSWETKFKLVDEALRWYRNEKLPYGDIDQARQRNHRLKLRLQQIDRDHHKLAEDMKGWLFRRDKITSAIENRNRFLPKRIDKIEGALQQRRAQTSRARLCHLKAQVVELENITLGPLTDGLEQTKNELVSVQRTLWMETNANRELAEQIHNATLLKLRNIETLVDKQHRAKFFNRLGDATKAIKKHLNEAVYLTQKQKNEFTQEKLIEVMELLIKEFPDDRNKLSYILNHVKN